MTTARQIVAEAHQRLLAPRLRLRHMLLNITTVEAALFRGARVCLRRQDNVNSNPPHYGVYFIVLTDKSWESTHWRILLYPTRVTRMREHDRYHVAINETINYLMALEEREPTRCEQCGKPLRIDNLRARFCNAKCVQDYENARRPKKRGA